MSKFSIWLENAGVNVWLDDWRDPKEPFIQDTYGARGDEIWVKTAQEAISVLKSRPVASISLDHDLGSPGNGTGLDVAKWIEEQAHSGVLPRLSWAVHSDNPVGRQNMRMALQQAEKFWDTASDL